MAATTILKASEESGEMGDAWASRSRSLDAECAAVFPVLIVASVVYLTLEVCNASRYA